MTLTSLLMLFRKTFAVFCENKSKYTDALRRQNAEFFYVKTGGAYSDHWALKG
jgi:hypothetical protein